MTEAPVPLSRLLEFLAPGIIHGLGNSLFAIHGNAQVMGESVERERKAILEASMQAQHTLEVLRCMSGQGPMSGSRLEACAVIPAVCDACKVSMRDFGVAVSIAPEVFENKTSLDVTKTVRAIAAVMLAIRERLPSGYEGSVRIDLECHRKRAQMVLMSLVQKPSFLPFPIDFAGVREEAGASVPGAVLPPDDGDGDLVRIDVRQA